MHGFSSLLLGIECKHSLLSRAASVAVFQAAQALNFLFILKNLVSSVVFFKAITRF